MEKKQNKVVAFVKEHKSVIVTVIGGAAVAVGLRALFLKTEYGKLYKVISRFEPGKGANKKSLSNGLTRFLSNADSVRLMSASNTVTIGDMSEDIAEVLCKDLGCEMTDKVSSIFIGIKK